MTIRAESNITYIKIDNIILCIYTNRYPTIDERITSAGAGRKLPFPLERLHLVIHPARSIQVATERRVRTRRISGQRLRIVIEPPEKLGVGRVPWGMSYLSDHHRAVLDAAQRPALVGGLEVLAEAFASAAPELRADILMDYARRLGWAAALRRLGSLADVLSLDCCRLLAGENSCPTFCPRRASTPQAEWVHRTQWSNTNFLCEPIFIV